MAHQHTEECFAVTEIPGEKVLVCTKEEHTHTEECYPQEEPAPEEQPTETPVPETPPVDEPTTDEPATDEPTTDEIVTEEPGTGEPTPETPPVDEPTTDEPTTDEPATDEIVTEEPGTGEPTPETPPVDEPTTDEIVSEEPGTDGTVTEESTGLDFEKWITNVSLQHRGQYDYGDWKDIEEGQAIDKNDQLRFKIDYTIPGNQLSKDNKVITYQIPAGITISKKVEDGIVYNSAGQSVGTYTISTDGEITITFDDEYAEDNANGSPITGDVYLEAKVDETKIPENGKVELPFKDDLNVDIFVKDETTENADLTVKKETSEIDNTNGTVVYTITVNSINGTHAPVTLNDVMNGVVFNGNFVVKDKDGNEVTGIVRPSEGVGNFTLELPQMDANGTYTITYTAKLKEDLVNGQITGSNRVTVNSEDENGINIQDEAEVDTTFTKELLKKTGNLNENQITWTIVVNGGKQDIGGWELSDILNGLEFNGTVQITPAVNGKAEITLPYTFPEGTKDTYTITYTTGTDRPVGEGSVNNKATLKPETGEDVSDGENIWIGNYDPLKKEATGLKPNADGTTATVNWKVTINADTGEIAAPWTYTDTLQNGQWYTSDQIDAIKAALNTAIGGKELTYTLTEIPSYSGSSIINGYKLEFTTPLKKGYTLEFTYQSTAPIGDGNSELTFANNADINNKVWNGGTITYRPVVKKYDLNTSGENTNHDYYSLKGGEGILQWGFDVAVPENYRNEDIIITEKLPDGVTLADNGLTIESSNVFPSQTFQFEENNGTATCNGHNITAVKDSHNSIIITIPPGLAAQVGDSFFHFTVKAGIKEDVTWTENAEGIPTAEFKNEVTVKTSREDELGTDSQIQTITKDDSNGVIEKTSTGAKDNIIPYSITINPDGKDLLKGADTLTMKDVLSYTCTTDYPFSATLVPDSVKVYYRKPDGTTGDVLPCSYTYDEATNEVGGGTYNYVNTLSVTIPDSKPLIVQYNYKLSAADRYSQTVSNKAGLEGVTSDITDSETNVAFTIVTSGATANLSGVTIYKVDSENAALGLQGAVFNLFKWDGQGYELVSDKNGNTALTTDKDGQLALVDIVYNTAYKLVETEAPEGYVKNETPYFFYIVNSNKDQHPECKPSDFKGELRTAGDVIYYKNSNTEIKPDTTEIDVQKKWFTDGNEVTDKNDGQITFGLYRKESTSKPDESGGSGTSGSDVNVAVDISCNNGQIIGNEQLTGKVGDILKIVLEWRPVRDEDQSYWENTDNILICNFGCNSEQVSNSVIKKVDGTTATFTYELILTQDMIASGVKITGLVNFDRANWTGAAEVISGSSTSPSTPSPEDGTLIGTYTLSNATSTGAEYPISGSDWSGTISGLPKTGKNASGETVYYTYYVIEQGGAEL